MALMPSFGQQLYQRANIKTEAGLVSTYLGEHDGVKRTRWKATEKVPKKYQRIQGLNIPMHFK